MAVQSGLLTLHSAQAHNLDCRTQVSIPCSSCTASMRLELPTGLGMTTQDIADCCKDACDVGG